MNEMNPEQQNKSTAVNKFAHDFNNILMRISGLLEYLSMTITDQDELKKIAEGMAAIDRGALMTKELLAAFNPEKSNISSSRTKSIQVAIPKKTQTNLQNKTILVVEDEEDLRELIIGYLSMLGYQLIPATGSEDALQQLNSGVVIDLLLTDFIMPGTVTGYELANIAGARHPGIKIMLMSGMSDNSEIGDKYPILKKPFKLEQLADVVREFLED